MNEHIEVLRGLLNYPGLREYVGRIIYDKAVAAVDAMGEQREPAHQPSVEKFSGTFRCESNGIVGYKNAPIHSVTMHDDGVIEVVIDHWPQQPLTDEHKAILKECRNQAMLWTLKARIPECGAFGGIAQDLDYLCGQLGLEEQEASNG